MQIFVLPTKLFNMFANHHIFILWTLENKNGLRALASALIYMYIYIIYILYIHTFSER